MSDASRTIRDRLRRRGGREQATTPPPRGQSSGAQDAAATASTAPAEGRRKQAGGVAAVLRSAGSRLRKAGPAGAVVPLLALVATGVLVAAELSPVLAIEIQQAGTCEIVAEPDLRDTCAPTGGQRHSFAFVLLALLGLVMAWGAGVGGSRAAAVAVLAVGAVVLAITLIRDLPATDETGLIGNLFEEAVARPAIGLYLAIAGGVLMVLAGIFGLLRGQIER